MMDEECPGRLSGEAAEPEEAGLAERLIRAEFGEPAPVFEQTAQAPAVATAAPGADAAGAPAAAIHDEFSGPDRPLRSRSHRTGMLAGLGVVGALLAALVLFSPSGGKPRLPAQSVHDVSPISASGPKTLAATAPAPTASPTTVSAPAPTTTTTLAHRGETVPSTVTYVNVPATTRPAAPPTPVVPAPPPTTSPPPPATTTTTAPSTTTTTHCLLGLLCS